MKKIKILFTMLAVVVLALGGCDENDYLKIYGPDGELVENPGRLIVDGGGNLPEGSTVTIIDEDGVMWDDVIPGAEADVEAGTYKLVVLAPPDGLTLNGTVATLSATRAAVGQAPVFSAGVSSVTVRENRAVEVSIPTVYPMTRQLVVRLSCTGFDLAALSAIEVDVYHPAVSVDVERRFGGVVASGATGNYTRVAVENPAADQITFTFNLLGFEPGGSHRMVIRFKAGSAEEEFAQDITAAVAGFNNGPATTPLVLATSVKMEDGEISGIIEPWEPGWTGDIPVD